MPSFSYIATTLEQKLALYSSLFPAGDTNSVRAAVLRSRSSWQKRVKILKKLGALGEISKSASVSLRNCWPCGIGWHPRDASNPVDACPPQYRFCYYSRLCPFCYGRASAKRGMAVLSLIDSLQRDHGLAHAYILDHSYVHPRVPRRRDVAGFVKKAQHPYCNSLRSQKVAKLVRGTIWRNSFKLRTKKDGSATFHVRSRQLLITAEPLPAVPTWDGKKYVAMLPTESYSFPRNGDSEVDPFSVVTRFLRYDVGLLKGKTKDLAWVLQNCPERWFETCGELRSGPEESWDADEIASAARLASDQVDEVSEGHDALISKNDEVQV